MERRSSGLRDAPRAWTQAVYNPLPSSRKSVAGIDGETVHTP